MEYFGELQCEGLEQNDYGSFSGSSWSGEVRTGRPEKTYRRPWFGYSVKLLVLWSTMAFFLCHHGFLSWRKAERVGIDPIQRFDSIQSMCLYLKNHKPLLSKSSETEKGRRSRSGPGLGEGKLRASQGLVAP